MFDREMQTKRETDSETEGDVEAERCRYIPQFQLSVR